MATAVQTTYRPQIAPAVVGLIASATGTETDTRIVETAAGVPFGVMVSQGVGDKGAILGGTKGVGISVRDVTLDRITVDPLAAVNIGPADTYMRYANMAVLSRGVIWVTAAANVAAGDAVFYEAAGGTLSNSASGTAASGSVVFATQPVAGQTITLNGTAWTFQASGASGNQVNIGPTLGDTIAVLATALNASTDTNTAALRYAAYPPSPGGSGQGSGANTLTYGVKAVGSAGNALVVTTTVPGSTVTPMSGGSAAATALTGAFWKSTAIAGQLAKVSLGIQR
jgi:hypothetical protein